MAKKRAEFFTAVKQQLIMEGYEKFQSLISTKGNNARASRTREQG